jgi:hypothetical protein
LSVLLRFTASDYPFCTFSFVIVLSVLLRFTASDYLVDLFSCFIECGLARVDLVIILDSSTSVGDDNYLKMKNFCFVDHYLFFCTFSFVIVLSVLLRFTASDYPFCTFSFVIVLSVLLRLDNTMTKEKVQKG